MATVPYESSRWEFRQVAREMRTTDRVVDSGCGGGAFLRMVKPLVLRAVGVDHNLDAIEGLRRAGVEGEVASFSDFAQRHSGDFDLACSFHTLEHLAEINQFMRALTRCVRPDGRIFLSVPNRRRFARQDDEPLDCPPHHVSRWDSPSGRRSQTGSGSTSWECGSRNRTCPTSTCCTDSARSDRSTACLQDRHPHPCGERIRS
jgi:SAM-dependent methyltransferase